MNIQDLQQALVVADGTLTLSRSTLGGSFAGLLDRCYQGQSIVIAGAAVQPGNMDSVVVTGRSTFLRIADLPVTARFFLDPDGAPQVVLRYRLRDDAPGPNAWVFSRSFSTLPKVWNDQTPVSGTVKASDVLAQQRPFVDSLALFDTTYVVTSAAGIDGELSAPLEPGINFVSRMRPQGALGLLESALGTNQPLTLHGQIRLPLPTDKTLALRDWERPWDHPEAPGIHLTAALDVSVELAGMTLDQTTFRIYTPLSEEWLDNNMTFQPLHGYTGRVTIPSAAITTNVSVDLRWGDPTAFLFARCEGIRLGKLSQLLDLAGTDSLASTLPEELQPAIDALAGLELMSFGLYASADGGRIAVSSTQMTIGLPGLVWNIWGDDMKVRDLACRFRIDTPSGEASKVGVTLLGTLDIADVPLEIRTTLADNYSLYAGLAEGQQLPLGALLGKFAPGVPPPSALTVDRMQLTIAPGRSYQFAMTLAGQPEPWAIPVGKLDITLSNLTAELTYPQGGPLDASFAGTAAFGEHALLAMNYVHGQSLTLRGSFRDIDLQGMIDELCDQAADLPPGFNLKMPSASILVSQRGTTYAFQAACEIADIGTFALEARRFPDKSSGFAGGVALSGAALSKLQGLEPLAALEQVAPLRKVVLLFSSFTDPQFTFPSMAQFNQPALATKSIALPAGSGGVIAGMNAFAEWSLDGTDKHQALLGKLLGLGGALQVTVQIGKNPAQNAALSFGASANIQGNPFTFKTGFRLTNGKASLFLAGALTLQIQGKPRIFDLTTLFVPGGMFLSATMKSTTAIDCTLFKLSNVGLEIGVNWACIPSLGVTATIAVSEFQSNVAMFFDSTNPSRSLVAGSVSDITLGDIVKTLLGSKVTSPIDKALETVALRGTQQFTVPAALAEALDGLLVDQVAAAFATHGKVQIPGVASQVLLVVGQAGKSWHLTDMVKMRHYQLTRRSDDILVSLDPQFYSAPQPTSIGSIMFPQGFFINAGLEFLGFKAQATVDISANRGISIDATMNRAVFGPDWLFKITSADGRSGPRLSISSMNQPNRPEPELRPPHFLIDGRINFMGLQHTMLVSVTVQGLSVRLAGPLPSNTAYDLTLQLSAKELSAQGSVQVQLGNINLFRLGTAKVNTTMNCLLGVRASGSGTTIRAAGEFAYMGQSFYTGVFEIEANEGALARLPDVFVGQATKLLMEAFRNSSHLWAEAVARGLVTGVTDTKQVLKDVYGKTNEQAKRILKDAEDSAKSVLGAVEDGAEDLGKKIGKLF